MDFKQFLAPLHHQRGSYWAPAREKIFYHAKSYRMMKHRVPRYEDGSEQFGGSVGTSKIPASNFLSAYKANSQGQLDNTDQLRLSLKCTIPKNEQAPLKPIPFPSIRGPRWMPLL